MATTRRDFLYFMTAAGATLMLPGCASAPKAVPFRPIKPTTEDALKLAGGFEYEILLRWRQHLNSQGERFGFNNDYLAYLPFPQTPDEGLMWVNHEYPDPYWNAGWRPGGPRTKEQVDIERKEVGGSIAHIKKSAGKWSLVENSKYNRRLDAFTPIPFVSEHPIFGKRDAVGTLAGCAGGVTPWGTVLSCEENYQNFVGEVEMKKGKRTIKAMDDYLTWTPHCEDMPPEHYGWVVEVDLKTGKSKKLTALGRFCHESATCVLAKDGRTVVYMGDDTEDEHLYKFISAKPGSLEKGELFVADVNQGKWMSLDRSKNKSLAKEFKTQTDLLIHTRTAAKILGATPLDRPEDIEVQPGTGAVFVSLTLSPSRGNNFGSLFKLEEKDGNPLSMEFQSSTFATGGPATGFACPDNLAFDKQGNLWMTSDISGSKMQRAPYEAFGNNGLFYIPLSGPEAGKVHQVASAPVGAEFTGPCFAPDGETLFLSVQHPGERAHQKNHFPSHWPDGGVKDPAPCVVQIKGPMMKRLLGTGALV
jgi:secreted PhoX family phosphatase